MYQKMTYWKSATANFSSKGLLLMFRTSLIGLEVTDLLNWEHLKISNGIWPGTKYRRIIEKPWIYMVKYIKAPLRNWKKYIRKEYRYHNNYLMPPRTFDEQFLIHCSSDRRYPYLTKTVTEDESFMIIKNIRRNR